MDLDFTGEFFVPGKSGDRIEADHLARYEFAARFAKGKSVLDIACGVGYGGPIFIDAGAETYKGVDLGHQQVAFAASHYASERVTYQRGDICEYQGDDSFDLIVCFETIEHVPDFRGALRNLASLLADGGTLIVSSPNRPVTSPRAKKLEDKPINQHHVQEFTPAELLAEMNAAGISTSNTKVYGQRLRHHFNLRSLNRLRNLLFGNADEKSSPVPRRYRKTTPRYFLIVASESDLMVNVR